LEYASFSETCLQIDPLSAGLDGFSFCRHCVSQKCLLIGPLSAALASQDLFELQNVRVPYRKLSPDGVAGCWPGLFEL